MDKIIFFDLENTLIPDWDQRDILLPLIHENLKSWIFDQMPFRAALLSFAVWNNIDIQIFNKEIRPLIKEHLFFDFDDDLILSKEFLSEEINRWNKTPFNTADDNCDAHKKDGIMKIIWKNKFIENDTHIILLDDTVEDMIISRTSILTKFGVTQPISNNTLEFVNPWSIIRSI